MKKIFILVLSIVITISGGGCTKAGPIQDGTVSYALMKPEKMPEQENESSENELFLYGRSFLPEHLRQVYDQLAYNAGQYDFDSIILIPPLLDENDLAILTAYFHYDYPQYYWAIPEVTLNESNGARSMRITAAEGLTPELIRKRQNEIDIAALQFLDSIDGDAFETVVSVHDRLVEQVLRDTSYEPDSGNIYGALVGNRAICDGYAKAFQYLMALKGVRCIYFQGEGSSGAPHAWNAVYIEDGWYYVDVTWDTLNAGRILHTHLCITLEELLREREFSPDQYPEIVESDSTAYNYFERLGYAVSPDDDFTAVRSLAEAFVNELSDRRLPAQEGLQFLEVKVYASPEQYQRVKDEFIQNPFLVLREMDRIAFERNLPFEIATEGSVYCNHKDTMQILILWPSVKKIR